MSKTEAIESVYSQPDIDDQVIEFENELNQTIREISQSVPFEERLTQYCNWKKY